jgi:hypothetical protein
MEGTHDLLDRQVEVHEERSTKVGSRHLPQ